MYLYSFSILVGSTWAKQKSVLQEFIDGIKYEENSKRSNFFPPCEYVSVWI